ncbi:hypothetical protein MTO96_043001, partial [Rhipicephalus appendiculatus]
FLIQKGYSYMVAVTGPVNVKKKCVRSYYLYALGSEINHQFKYVEDESGEAEDTGSQYYELHPKEVWIALFVHNAGKLLQIAEKVSECSDYYG